MNSIIAQSNKVDVDDRFIARRNELQTFYNNLTSHTSVNSLFVITGPGGIGKSTLLEQFEILGEKEGAVIGSCVSEINPINAMGVISKQFSKRGWQSPLFTSKYKKYIENIRKIGDDSSCPKGALESFVSIAAKVGFNYLPVAGPVLSAIGGEEVGDVASDLTNYLRKRFIKNKDEFDLMMWPVQVLSETFVTEFLKNKSKRIIIAFDGFEKSQGVFETWVHDLIIGKYGNLGDSCIFIISGRQSLDNNIWSDYSSSYRLSSDIKLTAFTKEDTALFLKKWGISEKYLIETYYQLSKGVPIVLRWLTSKPKIHEQEIIDVSCDVVNYLLNRETNLHKQIALSCSIPIKFNKDVLGIVINLSDEELMEAFEWVINQPFVFKGIDGYWYFHDWVREQFLSYFFDVSPETSREIHKKLERYYCTLRDQIKIIGDIPFRNEKWMHYESQRFYHDLCSLLDINISETLNNILVVFNQNYHHLTIWTNIILQVASEKKDSDLHKWGLFLKDFTFAWDNGDFEKIISCMTRLLESTYFTPENCALAYFTRGFSYYKIGIIDKSFSDFDSAIQINSQNSIAIARRGSVYALRGEMDRAIQDFSHSIQICDSCAWTYASRGVAYGKMGNYNLALLDLNKAIDLDNNYVWALTKRGSIYFQLKNEDLALSDWSTVIDKNPSYFNARALRGQYYLHSGLYELALNDFNTALLNSDKNNRSSAWVFASRGEAYRNLNLFQQAVNDFSHSLDLRDDDSWTLARLGTTYVQNHEYDLAMKYLDTVIKNSAQNDWAFAWRGELSRLLGQYNIAIKYFSTAIKINEKRARTIKDHFPWAYKKRGITYYEINRLQESLKDLNIAFSLEPSSEINDLIQQISEKLIVDGDHE